MKTSPIIFMPTRPLKPVKPPRPLKPVKPTRPLKPAKPTRPLKPVKPTRPLKPVKPTRPHPVKPPRPLKPAKPTKPLKPAKPLKPIKPFGPLKPQVGSPSAELARETRQILKLKEDIATSFWDLGQCLMTVHDRVLYTHEGFASFEQYLARGVSIPRTTAYRLMDLRRNFSRALARKHGQTKLIASIEFAKATPEQDRPIDVLAYQIEARGPDGKMQFKPFNDASGGEIKLAAARIRRRNSKKPKPVSEPGIFARPAWQTEALRSLRAIAPQAEFKISTGKGSDPKITLTLSNLPRSRLREALERLARAIPESH